MVPALELEATAAVELKVTFGCYFFRGLNSLNTIHTLMRSVVLLE